MALPKIKVAFRNGMLGTVTTGEDGVLLLCAKGTAVANTLKTDKAYKIYRLSGLEELGAKETTHAALYKAVKQFYTEAPVCVLRQGQRQAPLDSSVSEGCCARSRHPASG